MADICGNGSHVFVLTHDGEIFVWDGSADGWMQVLDDGGHPVSVESLHAFGMGCFGMHDGNTAATFVLIDDDGSFVVSRCSFDGIFDNGAALWHHGSGWFVSFSGTVDDV